MTKYENITVNNGQAGVNIDTSGLSVGDYIVLTVYKGNDTYEDSNTVQSNLTIEQGVKTVASIQIMINATSGAGVRAMRTLFAVFKDSNGNPITLDTSKFSTTITMNSNNYYGDTFPQPAISGSGVTVNYSGDTGVTDFSFNITNSEPYMQLL